MNVRTLSLFALATAGLVAAGPASAQSRTYDFTDRNVAGSPTGGCNTSLTATTGFTGAFGNTIVCQQSGNSSTTNGSQTLSVRAWSSDGPLSPAVTGAPTYRTAAVNDQGGSGFGIWNQTEGIGASPPAHSADNATPGVDMWQLDFSTSQALKSITLGWAGADGDFQVLRWGGAGPVTSVNGRTAAQLLTDGWVLMTTGATAVNVATDTVFNGNTTEPQTFNFNANNLTSTSWLISAYNSAFSTAGATTGTDEIKILGITTSGPQGSQVAEPGSLLLAALGIGAALRSRRRRSASRA